MQQPSNSSAMQPPQQSSQLPASSDTGPSSRLLMEDANQGKTSARAQRSIDRYAQFVAAQRAPVASMNYSPFTRSDHGAAAQHNGASHLVDESMWNNVSFVPSDLDDEMDVAASSASHSASHSRAHSPSPAIVHPSALDAEGRREFHALNPPVAHIKPGGEAWTVDFDNWAKTSTSNPGSKRASLSGAHQASHSHSGSKAGSVASSRKSSLNAGDPKLFARASNREQQLHAGHRGFESSQSIWHAQHQTLPPNVGGDPDHRYSRVNEVLSHLSKDKEAEYEREPKRGSIKHTQAQAQAPHHNFLRAHQSEAKLASKQHQQQLASFALGMQNKHKRASMPPLQNKRGGLMMSAAAAAAEQAGNSSSSNSRRGSMTSNSGVTRSLGASAALGATRNRSQSLPAESLFLAYSQCALPAVMTSSLASMPVPSQPAIPVAVARRYSVLSAAGTGTGFDAAADGFYHQHQRGGDDSMSDSACSTPTSTRSSSIAENEEEMVYVNPESVAGIDTSSVLDTTAVHDIASPGEDADTVAALCPQPARRGSLSLGRSGGGSGSVSESQSRHSSPASSPVDAGDLAAGPLAYPLSSPMASPAAGSPVMTYPASLTSSASPPSDTSASATSSSNSGGSGRVGSSERSRSLIHTKASGLAGLTGLTGANSGLRIQAPSRDQLPLSSSTPDYTPMTSPTNLSNAAFRTTLMSRRMSDVVARDIGKKLRILKAHMAGSGSEAAEDEREEVRMHRA